MPGKDLDGTAGPAAFLGAEVRLRREERGWSQRELGLKAHISPSRIAQIETASIPATLDNATALDVALETGGLFARLVGLMDAFPVFPDFVVEYMRLEKRATGIKSYAPMVVPGLLQTEGYARALLRAGRPRERAEEIEVHVEARISRQEVLTRQSKPTLWFVFEEDVFKRPVGGREVMAQQLHHLVNLCEDPAVVVQVLPTDMGAHAAVGGALTLLSLPDRAGVAYVEGPFSGQLFQDPETATECSLAYDLLLAAAHTREDSAAIVRQSLETMR